MSQYLTSATNKRKRFRIFSTEFHRGILPKIEKFNFFELFFKIAYAWVSFKDWRTFFWWHTGNTPHQKRLRCNVLADFWLKIFGKKSESQFFSCFLSKRKTADSLVCKFGSRKELPVHWGLETFFSNIRVVKFERTTC